MGKRLYVGNLAYTMKSSDLEAVFKKVGEVISAKVIMDKDSGQSKGFGFVEMGSDELGTAAVAALNGKDIGGRALKVTEANPEQDRPTSNRFGGNREGGFSRSGGKFGGNRTQED